MKKILMILSAAAFLFGSCAEPIELDNSSLELSDYVVNGAPEGGEYLVSVTSSETWRVSGKQCDWVELSAWEGQSGGTIVFKVSPNTDGELKETSFKVFAGSAVQEISVISNPSYYMDLDSEAEVNMPTAGGKVMVKFVTNIDVEDIDYEFSEPDNDWIKLNNKKTALGKAIFTFDVVKNESYRSKDMTVSFNWGDFEEEVSVSLAQLDAIFWEEEPDGELLDSDLSEKTIEFSIKSNVEYDFNIDDYDWIELVSEETGDMDEEGLVLTSYTIKVEKSAHTRSANLKFTFNGKTFEQFTVRQVNLDADFAEIEDEALRYALADMGWIYIDGDNIECEISETGKAATELVLDESYSFIYEIAGLGAFPALTSIRLMDLDVEIVDLEDCENISDFKINRCRYIGEICLGDNPVTELTIGSSDEGLGGSLDEYLDNGELEISSSRLERLNMYFHGDEDGDYYDSLEELYVYDCPSLKYLNAYRLSYYFGDADFALYYVYLSEEQMEAYEDGNLDIIVYDGEPGGYVDPTEIEVW